MAELWGLPEVNEWWLPDEGTCPPVVRIIRSFTGNRLPHAERESRSEDQRNIKGIFSQLSLHESPKAGLIQVGGGRHHLSNHEVFLARTQHLKAWLVMRIWIKTWVPTLLRSVRAAKATLGYDRNNITEIYVLLSTVH